METPPPPTPPPDDFDGKITDPSAAQKKPGWIEGLAKRSTGLPGETGPRKPPSTTTNKSAWRYAGVGLQFAGTTALFTVMGYGLDREMGWTPWGTVGLTMLGLIGGLYLLIKEALKDNAPSSAPPDGNKGGKR